jgi:hypothetical protein
MWTLIAVAMLGLGLLAGAEVYSTLVRREKERELLFIGNQFREAIRRYYEAPGVAVRRYPPSLDDLLRDSRVAGMRRYLRRIYADPFTGKSEWGLVIVAGGIAGVHSLSEAAPLKVDNFEPRDAALAGKKSYKEWVFTHPPDLLLRRDDARAAAVEPDPKPSPRSSNQNATQAEFTAR